MQAPSYLFEGPRDDQELVFIRGTWEEIVQMIMGLSIKNFLWSRVCRSRCTSTETVVLQLPVVEEMGPQGVDIQTQRSTRLFRDGAHKVVSDPVDMLSDLVGDGT